MFLKQHKVLLIPILIAILALEILIVNRVASTADATSNVSLAIATQATPNTNATVTPDNSQYALFVYDRKQFYSYQMGAGNLSGITLPSTLVSYFSFPTLSGIDWSNTNHAFLIVDADPSHANIMYRIADSQINAEPITFGALPSAVVPEVAQWSPDGKSIVLTYYRPDPKGAGANNPTYYFLAVYTPGTGFRTLISQMLLMPMDTQQ